MSLKLWICQQQNTEHCKRIGNKLAGDWWPISKEIWEIPMGSQNSAKIA